MMRRRVRQVILATLIAAAVGACGVPREERPQIVERKDVPFGLSETSTTTTRPNVAR
jgi:hypothetical protein